MRTCVHTLYRYALCRASLILVLTFALALVGTVPAWAQVLGTPFGDTTQFFPHFNTGGGYTNFFVLHNPTASPIIVQGEFYRSDGTPFMPMQFYAVGPLGSETVTMPTTSAGVTTGWARLTSTLPFSASELFQYAPGGVLDSQVGILPAVSTNQFKIFVLERSSTGTRTGVAIANPSPVESTVLTVRLIPKSGQGQPGPDGQTFETRTVTLRPLEQLARFLDEAPYFPGLDNFEGIVDIAASQPAYAVTFRLDGPKTAAIAVITPAATIADGSITTLQLADRAVTNPKIAPGAVTSASILDGTITDNDIASSANIAPTKIAGTAATLGSNTFQGTQTINGDLNLGGVLFNQGLRFLSHSGAGSNTFLGVTAGNLTMTGNGFNTAIGVRALNRNSTGSSNTATGGDALLNNTSGSNNTAIGNNALQQNATGNGNTAVGQGALQLSTGNFNTATGSNALGNTTTGFNNTAFGETALNGNTTGFLNVGIGQGTLILNTTGNSNTAIGSFAGTSSANLTNATAIGANATVDASNKIRLGNTAVTVIQGQVGFTASSDKNQKEKFRPVDAEGVLTKLRDIDVTSWNFIGHDPEQFRHYGPMAQDFFAAFGHDGVGTIGSDTTINSTDLSGILMLAVKALEKRTTDLQAENAELKTRLEAAERSRVEAEKLKERIEKLEQLLIVSGPRP